MTFGMAPSRLLHAFVLAACALVLGSRTASALGEGTIVNGKLNLLVYFAYDELEPDSWEPVFTEYSRLLANATEGQLQLGTVSFTKCAQQKGQADVWILDDFSGARAHLGGVGVPGLHMTISQTHKSVSGGSIGQFGLVHETGHYVWGVYDEYKGYVGNTATTDPLHYCATPNGSGGCFMDGGTTVFPNNLRTEFCTQSSLGFADTAHFRGANNSSGQAIRNAQEYFLARSCWERIEQSGVGGLVHPSAPPSTLEPSHQDVVFDFSRLNGPLGLALVIDKSGSMSSEGKLELAIRSAQTAVGLLRDGEYLTVVAFDDAPTTVVAPTVINATTKAAAIAALGSIVAEGGTEIGAAVLRTVTLLTNVPGCKEFLVVLTDGVSDGLAADDPAVLAALADGNHSAFGVALGSFSDDAGLIAVSNLSGGQFYKPNETTDLPLTFAQIFAQASGGLSLEEAGGVLAPAASVSEREFDVAAAAVNLNVSLGYAPGSELALELVQPDGSRIDFELPPLGVEAFASSVQKRLVVPQPAPGTWKALVTESSGTDATFDFLAWVDTLDFALTTRAASDAPVYPAETRLAVHVVAGVPVGGADVEATVQRPDGTRSDLRFFDDGLFAHGDEKEDDGVYTTRFASYTTNGSYVFEVRVANTRGHAAGNQECGVFGRPGPSARAAAAGLAEEGQTSPPIAPFTGCTTHTVVLTGQTGTPTVGTATLAPHSALEAATELDVAEAAPTPLLGFALQAGPGEALAWERFLVHIDAPGAGAGLGSLALLRDSDADGLPDSPRPLARGQVVAGRLLFENPGTTLDLVPAGSTAHYLVTAGEALVTGRSRLDGQSGGAGGLLGKAPDRPHRSLPGALVVGLLLLSCAVLRRRTRRLALTTGLLLAVACSTGSTASEASTRLRISPTSLELHGATTGQPTPTTGTDLVFHFRLR